VSRGVTYARSLPTKSKGRGRGTEATG
jgi:hypothetical protein